MLTELERSRIRSLIRNETLKRTVKRPSIINHHERETAGADPWDTRSAPGHDPDLAHDHRALVS